MNKKLIFIGDIHGEFREMIWKATQQYKIKDANLIVLGDFGVGFDNRLKYDYERTKKRLEKFNLEVYTIRGNHDNPDFFKEGSELSDELKKLYPKIHFLEDHRIYEICDKKIYTIGGGGSSDITLRTPGKDWWEGEYIKEIPVKDLPGRVDIIISHEAPLTFEPVLTRFSDIPEDQYQKILKGRKYLELVLKEVRCDYWFYGHYHQHFSGSYSNMLYKGLGINEFYEQL